MDGAVPAPSFETGVNRCGDAHKTGQRRSTGVAIHDASQKRNAQSVSE